MAALTPQTTACGVANARRSPRLRLCFAPCRRRFGAPFQPRPIPSQPLTVNTPLRRFASFPRPGGEHLWPGRAGSTVFLAQARGSVRICEPVERALP